MRGLTLLRDALISAARRNGKPGGMVPGSCMLLVIMFGGGSVEHNCSILYMVLLS